MLGQPSLVARRGVYRWDPTLAAPQEDPGFWQTGQVKGSRAPLRFVSTVRRLVSNLRATERWSR